MDPFNKVHVFEPLKSHIYEANIRLMFNYVKPRLCIGSFVSFLGKKGSFSFLRPAPRPLYKVRAASPPPPFGEFRCISKVSVCHHCGHSVIFKIAQIPKICSITMYLTCWGKKSETFTQNQFICGV